MRNRNNVDKLTSGENCTVIQQNGMLNTK